MKKTLVLLLLVLLLFSGCKKEKEKEKEIVVATIHGNNIKMDQEQTLDGTIKFLASKELATEYNTMTGFEYYSLIDKNGKRDISNKKFDVALMIEQFGTVNDKDGIINSDPESYKNVVRMEKTINNNKWTYYSYTKHEEGVEEDYLVHVYYFELENSAFPQLLTITFSKAEEVLLDNSLENVIMNSIEFIQ